MPYQLKSTGPAASASFALLCDPDTGAVTEYASSSVNADMAVGANVTLSSLTWKSATVKTWTPGSGTADADFVKFGTNKASWTLQSGQSRTVIFFGAVAGSSARIIGKSSGAYFATQNLGLGGSTNPTVILGSTASGTGAPLSSGNKAFVAYVLTHGSPAKLYRALESDSTTTEETSTTLSPSGTTFEWAIGYVNRREDSTAHQQDQTCGILIIPSALTKTQIDAILADPIGQILESAADTTPPTLTSPDFTATGSTTGTASVSTNEGNGTLYCVVTTSATSPSAAQVKAGQNHTGASAAYAASQAVSSTGSKSFSATGLSPSTAYYAHFVHTDGAANDSSVSTDATGDTTSAAGDTTPPVLSSPVGTATGSTTATIGATTDEGNGTLYGFVSTSATPPSDADLIAGTGAVWAGSVAVSSTGAKTLNATGLTASTGYYAHLLHRDAAANDSNTVTSAQFTTSAAGGDDIRLQPALDLDSGADAASLSGLNWCVFTDHTMSAVAHAGSGLSTNSSGQPTIDIDGSDFSIGDWPLLLIGSLDVATSPESDRTVLAFLGYVEAVAQA